MDKFVPTQLVLPFLPFKNFIFSNNRGRQERREKCCLVRFPDLFDLFLFGLGLQVDVSNKYVKIVDNPFKITNVTLGPKCQKGEKVTLMLQQGNDDAYALCTLESGSINQYQMNLSFEIGEEITFYLDSDKLSDKVHLTGMYLGEEIPSDFDFDEEDEDDEEDDSEIDYFDDEEEHSDLDDDEEEICDFPGNKAVRMNEVEEFSTSDSEEELSAEEMPQEQRKPQAPSSKKPEQQAKQQQQQQQQQQSDEGKKGKKRESEPAQPVSNKKQKPNGQEQKTKGEEEEDSSKLKKFPNGLVVQEVSKGKGALIKEGSRVGIYYTGKLQNGKVFDSKTSGKPLMFTVGKKHVIPGMEQGIVGMNYGGKRVITIPPQLGYGKQSQPGIPSNSTLIFEITALESK